MKHITKILKKNNFIPELGYIIVLGTGAIVYNGQLGVYYSRKTIGDKLCGLADKHGSYAIPETSKFLQTVNVLEDISSIALKEKESVLTIKFAGKGVVDVPLVLNISEEIPHLQIKWKTYEEAKKEGLPLSSLWSDISKLITNEGEALWGDVIGVYGDEKKLVSFDYGIYLHSDEIENIKIPDFYCPRALVELGLNAVDYLVVDEENVYLVGKNVQYVCCGVESSPTVKEMVQLKSDFEKGEKKKVTLNLTSGLWRRAKLFSSAVLTMKVRAGEIFVEHDTWSECIGKTEAPDTELNTRVSLLERWASGTLNHSISLSEEGTWSLHGKTRGGLHFYAVLTNTGVGIDEETTEESSTDEKVSDEVDIPEGSSLL